MLPKNYFRRLRKVKQIAIFFLVFTSISCARNECDRHNGIKVRGEDGFNEFSTILKYARAITPHAELRESERPENTRIQFQVHTSESVINIGPEVLLNCPLIYCVNDHSIQYLIYIPSNNDWIDGQVTVQPVIGNYKLSEYLSWSRLPYDITESRNGLFIPIHLLEYEQTGESIAIGYLVLD